MNGRRPAGSCASGSTSRICWRRSATHVDKILKGAEPASLPVEQPTAFDLIVNVKTAGTLGLTVPQAVLTQATEIVE